MTHPRVEDRLLSLARQHLMESDRHLTRAMRFLKIAKWCLVLSALLVATQAGWLIYHWGRTWLLEN